MFLVTLPGPLLCPLLPFRLPRAQHSPCPGLETAPPAWRWPLSSALILPRGACFISHLRTQLVNDAAYDIVRSRAGKRCPLCQDEDQGCVLLFCYLKHLFKQLWRAPCEALWDKHKTNPAFKQLVTLQEVTQEHEQPCIPAIHDRNRRRGSELQMPKG